jgi:hypothetical protein
VGTSKSEVSVTPVSAGSTNSSFKSKFMLWDWVEFRCAAL